MDEQQKKTLLKDTFEAVSSGYDSKALRFFPNSARFLAENLSLRGDEKVLDVACGTGNATFAIAAILPRGHVIGIDFSSGMLEQARRKAASANIGNIEFLETDMHTLEFPDGHFDAAVCSFGIFFAEDMDVQLSKIVAAVKPGGTIAISGFEENLFRPLTELFFERLSSYGIQQPALDWKRIASEERCREFFKKAGIGDIRVEQKNMGYFLDGPDEWWAVIWNAGFRRLVSGMLPDQREQFRREHMEEVEALRTSDGIWLNVGVLFSFGAKPYQS